MLQPGLLELKGAQAQTKYTSLAAIKFIAGLMTQRSPFAAIDTRYGSQFLGGKPDALIAGSNCEISNKLTLKRRPGLVAYGTASIPPPLAFYDWQESLPSSIQLMVDTANAVYTYSPTAAGIYFNKATGAAQSNFYDLVNTLYIGDGVDLFKIVGPNLLKQSNTFGSGSVVQAPWVQNNGTSTFVTGQTDPNGGTTATQITLATVASAGVFQPVTPNITPVASNTFTFSIWLKQSSFGAITITLLLQDQALNNIVTQAFAVTSTWTRYQITGTFLNTSTSINALFYFNGTPGANTNFLAYGAQLEVGGPAKPTEITTTKAQGVYGWGITGPVTGATLAFALAGPARWQASHAYVTNNTVTDSNGNLETAQTNFTSTTTEPTWATQQNSFTNDGSTVNAWLNGGPSGLSPKTGYQYYYAFLNSTTGQPSNVSPISATTGPLIGQAVTVTGARSTDPQVDKIAIYRNTDGGAFFYQLAIIANPTSGTWSFVDTTQDSGLTTSIFAPIGGLNTPPPAGLVGMEFHASRLWGFVGTKLFYASSNDNASALNVIFNGVSAESWAALNVIPFNAPITRIMSSNAGLLVFTTQDIWIVYGQDLTTFTPVRLFAGHGLRSFNSLDVDGSSYYLYLADREFISLSPSAGSQELGFPIGDLLEANFDPTKVYVTRHIHGSQDNALYMADGSTGWHRLNPNQVGASLSGEQSPLWSPFATITNGCGAIGSIETTPGVHQLLVGSTTTGPVLARSITTFSDNGSTYTWSATIGSILMTTAGTLAETESISVESLAAVPGVAVLLDEISGSFETLSNFVPDPPQLVASSSLNSNRWYLSQGTVPPLGRHMQIQLSGVAAATADEILSIQVRGVRVPEQVE